MSTAAEIAGRFKERVGGPFRALRAIAVEFGYIDGTAEAAVAEVFNLSRAEVRGIVSFYEDFKTTPPPPLRVRVCQGEACLSVGAREMARRVQDGLGVELGSANETASLEAVYCLGLCAQGPAMMVNERPLARTDALDLADVLRPVR